MWRRSTIPLTVCSGLRRVSRSVLTSCIEFLRSINGLQASQRLAGRALGPPPAGRSNQYCASKPNRPF
ncbi:hypothetical protein X963_5379 [Burkholderia pseudomallei MSHR7498]|nr:hypothetical protein X992_5678 [Burkholderia pseudomallei MSHR5492]KGS92290.1 hypothetical protein X963_5379 [Burkholderia pseudomallei MSHR7498]